MEEMVAGWVGGREVGAQTELQTLGVDLQVSDNLPPEGGTRPGPPRMRPRQRHWALDKGTHQRILSKYVWENQPTLYPQR